MNPTDDTKETTVTFRAVSRDEEGRKRVQNVEVESHNLDTLKHVEKKLVDKGVQRQDRRPADGIPLGRQHKSGHGGKYTWEGPRNTAENELEAAPPAMDENDPNYVDEEAEEEGSRGPKLGEEGVARMDIEPQFRTHF